METGAGLGDEKCHFHGSVLHYGCLLVSASICLPTPHFDDHTVIKSLGLTFSHKTALIKQPSVMGAATFLTNK